MAVYDQRGQQVETQYNAAGDIIINPPPRNAQQQRNRRHLLQKVRQFWVDGVLDHSLHQAALIELELAYQPEAVQQPWAILVQETVASQRLLAPRTTIRQLFAVHHGLLILGEPGAGKTTLLLELAHDLLTDAEQDAAQPMPVVFNLSSWATHRRPLTAWLVDELNQRYDVPRAVGQAWVTADELLPLLDGLDEVQQEHRAACVEAINIFRRDHGLVGLVVCSRSGDYEALAVHLKLAAAVLIQPLTPAQIDTYLARAGDQLMALRTAISGDAVLQELAETPLMLSIMMLTYHGMPREAVVLNGTARDQRRQLFAAYVERMFARRGVDMRYSRLQTIRWLTWLARTMAKQGQSVFLIERLQPDWLPASTVRRQYTLVDRLVVGLVIGLVVGQLLWLHAGLTIGLIGGLFGGDRDTHVSGRQRLTAILINAFQGWLVVGLVVGLVHGLPSGLIEGLAGVYGGLSHQLLEPLAGGGLYGVLAGALTGRPHVQPRWVIPVEALGWSWSRTWRAVLSGLLLGLLLGLLNGLSFGLYLWLFSEQASSLLEELVTGILAGQNIILHFGLILGLVGGLLSGLQGNEVETKVRPNQGIWRSARRALQVGLLGLLSGFLIMFGGLVIMLSGWDDRLQAGLQAGLIVALAYGGYACLSHLALRFTLWHNGYLPWRLGSVRKVDSV